MKDHVEIGTVWRRINGKERVEVRRIWFWPGEGWTVRAHPIRGGRVLVADRDWFAANYAREEEPGEVERV